MAEPTEQEQIKQTQTLEKIQTGQSEVVGRLDTVINSLKETSAHEEAMIQVAEQGNDAEKVLAKIDNKKLSFSERSQKIQEKNTGILENFVDAFEDSSDNTKDYQKMMEGIEQKNLGIQKAADAKDKREDKFLTRGVKATWGGIKTGASKLAKSVGTFTENLAKLAGLVLLWALLKWGSWEKAKEMWNDFKDKVNDWIDNIIPEWIQNLDAWQIILGGLAAMAGTWLVFKKGIATAKWGIRKIGVNLGAKLGFKSALRVQLDDTVKAIDNLTGQKNALKRMHDLETNVGKQSKLATQIDDLEIKIEKLTTDKNAMKKALAIDDMLGQNSSLATQIDEADVKLKNLHKQEGNVLKKIKNLGTSLDKDSKLSTLLDEIQKSIASIEDEKGALQKMLKLNKEELKTAQNAKKIQGLMKQVGLGGRQGGVARTQLRAMGIDPDTGVAFADAADAPTKSRALMSAEEIMEDNLKKRPRTRTSIAQDAAARTKLPDAADTLKTMKPKGGLLSKLKGGFMKGAGMTLEAFGWLFKWIGTPVEGIRGFKAGWLSVKEDAPWDIKMRAGWLGMWRNVGDLVFTDTLRGLEALGGFGADIVKGITGQTESGGFEMGATDWEGVLGSKKVDQFLTDKLVGIKKGTRIEDRLMSGEFTNPDGSFAWKKLGDAFGPDDKLRIDTGTGEMKISLAQRADMLKREKAGKLTAVESAYLTAVRATGDVGNEMLEINREMLEHSRQNTMAGRVNPRTGQPIVMKQSSQQVIGRGITADQNTGVIGTNHPLFR